MQPERTPTEWQQPAAQPTQAPYVAQADTSEVRQPVVTLSPDDETTAAAQSVVQEPAGTPDESDDTAPLHWQAKEYIQRDKTSLWFVVFGLVFFAVLAAAIFLIKSVTFTILVPIMAASLLMYVYRPPRMLNYTLSNKGVFINDELYPFNEFKAFGVVKDGDEYSVMLVPAKRFKPGVTLFFPEDVGEPLVDLLGARLPMKELKLDLVDRLIRKLRI